MNMIVGMCATTLSFGYEQVCYEIMHKVLSLYNDTLLLSIGIVHLVQ